MKALWRATWDEAVAAWLRAEAASPRFGHHLRLEGIDRRVIERPNLRDPAENALRRQLLAYRDDILTTIPDDTEWWEIELTTEDLPGLLAIDYPAWEIYSNGTGSLLKVAQAIRDGVPPPGDHPKMGEGLAAIRENVQAIYRALGAGQRTEALILLGQDATGPFTVIEGNKRAAALCWRHCLDGIAWPGVPAIAGVTSHPCPWLSPHA